jgi:hypothetical protein
MLVGAASSKASIANIYYAQNATVTNDGTSCANAYALHDGTNGFNAAGKWGAGATQIGPDTIVHFCGTYTGTANEQDVFFFQGSGTSGHPITLLFESGANLTSPVWGSFTGSPITNHQSFIVIDGGVNGVIQNTANGTGLAFEQNSGAIYSDGSNVTIQNWHINNLCVRTSFTDTNGCVTSGSYPIGIQFAGSNNVVQNNTMHDTHSCIHFQQGTTDTNNVITNNTCSRINHAIRMALNAGANSGTMEISHNNMFDAVNWDDTTATNTFHHNGIFVFQGFGGTQSGAVNIFDNWIHGDWGFRQTGDIFIDPNGGTVSNVRIFNNLMINGSTSNGPSNGYITGCGTNTAPLGQIYSNIIFGNGFGQSGIKTDSPCTIENNIISTVPTGIFVNPGTTLTTSNFNVLFNLTGLNVMFSGAGPSGTGFATVAAWTSATGFDANSSIANPNLNAASSPPYQPQTGSSAILLGTNLTSLGITALNVDYLGVARPVAPTNWTAGAYQFTGGGPVPPAAPTGLNGSVAGSTASLNWTASSGSPTPTAYTLYRGTVHGGPYSVVKSGLTSLTTTDTPANGTYFYVVTAYIGGIVSSITGNGTTATVTCTATCTFASGTTVTIGGNTLFNGTFTSTGQPTGSTFTFSSATSGTGNNGGAWQPAQESAKSNEISLTVPAALTVTLLPATRIFGNQTVGTSSASQAHVLTNTSGPGGTVTISGKSISTGANPGDFSFTDNCPSLLLSGLNCTFNITFTPTAGGTRSANLTVSDNASGSPQVVTLSGTGVAQTPGVSLNPTSLNFGDQTLSTTSTVRSIILTNTGSGALTISSVVASGDFAVVTVPVTNCGGTLASLATCSLNVTFTPTATGGRTGAVTVTDNASGSPHVATLSGNGITTKCQMTGNVTLSGVTGVCQ